MSRARDLANFADNTAGLETLTVSDITDLTATATELNHSSGVGSALQTQIDAKLASSSYTASDVLTKIKTVDGASSGLDADTLDGFQGSSYLRTDAVDSASGTYTFSGGGNDVSDTPVLNLTAGYISVPHDEVLLKFDEGQKMITSNDAAGNFNIRAGHDNDQLHVGSSNGDSGMSAISLDSDGMDGEIHLYVGPQRSAGSTANADYGLSVERGTNGLKWRTGNATYGADLATTYSVWHALNSGGCRTYVQFDGEGTIAIRISLNVSSITDGGTGWYTVNMTTAMPTDDFCALATGTGGNTSGGYVQLDSTSFGGIGTFDQHKSSSAFNLRGVSNANVYTDHPIVCAAVFR